MTGEKQQPQRQAGAMAGSAAIFGDRAPRGTRTPECRALTVSSRLEIARHASLHRQRHCATSGERRFLPCVVSRAKAATQRAVQWTSPDGAPVSRHARCPVRATLRVLLRVRSMSGLLISANSSQGVGIP